LFWGEVGHGELSSVYLTSPLCPLGHTLGEFLSFSFCATYVTIDVIHKGSRQRPFLTRKGLFWVKVKNNEQKL
jgi:hypothetical protein